MSAIPLIIASLKSAPQWVEFQLLKPMGGVLARPSGSRGAADAAVPAEAAAADGESAGPSAAPAGRAAAGRAVTPAEHSNAADSAATTLRRARRVVRRVCGRMIRVLRSRREQ